MSTGSHASKPPSARLQFGPGEGLSLVISRRRQRFRTFGARRTGIARAHPPLPCRRSPGARRPSSPAMMRFLDTNILLYSISTDRDESAKREVATGLLAGRDNALSVQVLQEFYVQATRPTRCDALPHAVAAGLMRAWLRFPVQDITLAVLSARLKSKSRPACPIGMRRLFRLPVPSAVASFSPRTCRTVA